MPSHYFIGEARKLNLELAVNVRKAAAGQVSMLVDQMVDHAMRYASVSEEHLYTNEFSQWMSSNTKFVVWMESLGKAWMVTKQQKQQELAAFASAVGGGGEPGGGLKPARGGGAQRAPAAADAMQTVIKAGDVGKTVGNVVKTLAAGETPYPGGGASAASGPMTSGPGGTWWNRAFTNRSHAARTQVRPRTHFDYVTLADVALVFQKEIASGRVYTKPAFRQVMRCVLASVRAGAERAKHGAVSNFQRPDEATHTHAPARAHRTDRVGTTVSTQRLDCPDGGLGSGAAAVLWVVVAGMGCVSRTRLYPTVRRRTL